MKRENTIILRYFLDTHLLQPFIHQGYYPAAGKSLNIHPYMLNSKRG